MLAIMITRLYKLVVLAGAMAPSMVFAQTDNLYGGLHWRMIGPFRGGRALAVCGVPGSPESFYFGAVGGGVWKTQNAGRTWTPIFDKESSASIGAIAVAPSDPNIVYVGSGEADMRSDIQQGDGMYRSDDAGRTWTHIGLEDSRQIGKVLVDPKDPNTVYVAALGHQYGPNEQRGVFKSTDGGKNWEKVLSKDANTGAIDMDFDPTDSNVIYASMWQTRRPPWSVYPPSNGPGSGLYKSTDAGKTWTQVKGGGFPSMVGHIGISVSPADHSRVYTCVDSSDKDLGGVYRSDDAGATWTHVGADPRVWGRGWYFMGITADPKNADQVYVMNTSAYRSTDGGKTFIPFKGAPGGDDYHTCWIDPTDSSRIAVASDQGTVISVDGGASWSTWYNQPTGQFYHVITDNRFPYWVYGTQQDSGAMALPSRTIHTGLSALYQRPIDAGGESGTIAPDPLHPGTLFSSTGSKEDLETGVDQNIDPTLTDNETAWRNEWTMPIATSPANPKALYTSHQKIFKSLDGGESWRLFSPDLTRQARPPLANLDPTTTADHDGPMSLGVVYWIAPSPLKAEQVWAGTDDGLIWRTLDDGAHWRNVTPAALTAWSKVGVIDASHFSTETAYAAIDRHRVDDNHPYIYRTHDGGKTWKLAVNGIPSGQFVNVVREDPRKKGLLYAGTDWAVYVSFDDGDHWRSLQLNMPAASVRDIVFGAGDVVAGTHGRAIWILDSPSVLRQISASGAASAKPVLYKPDTAMMVLRAGSWGFGLRDEGTPYPPEEPQGENPDGGAVIDYNLPTTAKRVDFYVTDENGKQVRKISSADKAQTFDPDKMDIPAHWIRNEPGLSTTAGHHRYAWDFHSTRGPLVPPGHYTIALTVDGHSSKQTLTVVKDPRLLATDADLRAQYKMALQVGDEIELVRAAQARAQAMLKKRTKAADQAKLKKIIAALGSAEGGLGGVAGAVQSAPAAPTKLYIQGFEAYKRKADDAIAKLKQIQS